MFLILFKQLPEHTLLFSRLDTEVSLLLHIFGYDQIWSSPLIVLNCEP